MIVSASTLVPSGTILARRRTIEGQLRRGTGAIQDGMGGIPGEPHSGQDGQTDVFCMVVRGLSEWCW
jgi:hypothetical protein